MTSFPAQAQVSLSPMVIDLQANRGQAQASINVSNNSDQPFRARVYAQPFTYDRVTGFKTLTSSPNDLNPYLQFSPRELVIPPGVSRKVRLITRFPPNFPEGEYRAVIFTEKLDERIDQNGNKVNIATRIGATVYVRQGKLSNNLVVDSASWNQEQKQIQLLVKSTGKLSARTTVKWTLKQGNKVIKQGLTDSNYIIAESDRYIPLSSSQQAETALVAGEYQITGELLWGENNQNQQKFNINVTIPNK
ncbi:P pilus assembly protein, chaperone PapD [Nostoc sp. FACHB-152]|uniref:P pilus assembly protein, chaperone PapD n=1 Tax=unclassified Nostoc TaxID=2593658 RepID=UPI0016827068|nr:MULTISPECIES: P pilus assembly protein, chaperone PapD [unclassified Nostoc]MBD2451450.1 P pilus assembly protein, chaperone PapD [Nostoc sp. FACHB-152]MBD2469986.1 P pilus assembly protein, chaperone PapD [Nostoc sp. FACHB-145]